MTKIVKAPRAPEEVIKDLAPAYTEWKGGEKEKNKLKDEFFAAITKSLIEEGEQAEDLVTVKAENVTEAKNLAERERPGWVVQDLRKAPDQEGFWEVIVEENPAFQPFTIEFDGKVWGRQIVAGPTLLDNEKIQAENPTLWKEITAYPHEELLNDIAYEAGMHQRDIEEYIARQCERHGVERYLLPLQELPDEITAELKEYIYDGPPSVKLPAPKKAESADG